MTVDLTQTRLVRALVVPLIVLAWLAVLLGVAWLLAHVTHALLVLVLSTVVAFALTPVVSLLDRWLPRSLAIAIAYVFGFAVLMGLLSVVIGAISRIINHQRKPPARFGIFSPILLSPEARGAPDPSAPWTRWLRTSGMI